MLSNVLYVRFYRNQESYSPVFGQGDPPRRSDKYILAEVSRDGSKKIILRSLPDCPVEHLQIVDLLEHELGTDGIKILGGGRLSADHDSRTLEIGEKSAAYGLADRAIVQQLLQEALPDWTVNIAPYDPYLGF